MLEISLLLKRIHIAFTIWLCSATAIQVVGIAHSARQGSGDKTMYVVTSTLTLKDQIVPIVS